ncbi:Putative extracellular membrane protein, CFEM [Septoria linicola]|uniref:Extracellular membrane protein, CFEM n=1 Tax=Septoria linicola TaxID=215465 RepID=A0A9Q9EPM3_9PEZI|nr:putative extracellular membrane protein, CFEM [Septoria linicola]USW57839.1 Putative extracellular membrane protein, CFEM [Septoria linicola]
MFKLAAVALFASIAYAQIPGLPDCAQGCITDYGGCNQVDVKCICENQPLLETLSCCVSQNCDESGTQEVIKFADTLCGSFGVTGLPTAASCAATASATAAPSGSSTESSASTVTSVPASVSSVLESASSAATGSASQTGTTAGAETTGTGTSAAAAPTHMAQKVLGFGLGAAGLLAVL